MAKDLRKLCIRSLGTDLNEDSLRKLCEKFGHVVHFNRPVNRPDLAFAKYLRESDAENGMEGLKLNGYNVAYAIIKEDSKTPTSERSIREEFRSKTNLRKYDEDTVYVTPAMDTASEINDQVCIRCCEEALFTCERCGDYYCSEQCQRSDWKRHKPLCIPLPNLIRISHSHADIKTAVEKMFGASKNFSKSTTNCVVQIDTTDSVTVSIDKSVSQNSTDRVVTLTKPDAYNSPVDVEEKMAKITASNESVVTAETVIAQPAQSKKEETTTSPINEAKLVIPPAKEEKQSEDIAEGIKSNEEVVITHPHNHYTVFVRSSALNGEFTQLINDIATKAVEFPALKKVPERLEKVAAPFEGAYYRAVVINVSNENKTVKVAYLDFGNTNDAVALNDLKELPNDIKNHRRYSFKYTLKGVSREVDNADDLKQHLQHLCDTETVLTCNEIDTNKEIELAHAITNESVNKELQAMVKNSFRLSNLQRKQLTMEKPTMIILSNSGIMENLITCVEKGEDGVRFSEYDTKVQEFGMNNIGNDPYYPDEGELCVVKQLEDGETCWYRAEAQEILPNGKQIVLWLFDYGRNETANLADIRPFSDEIAFEILSVYCHFKDVDQLKKSYPGEQLAEKFAVYSDIEPKSIKPVDEHYHMIVV